MNKFWLYLVRLIFLALILFEAANLFQFIKFDLDYSWFGLIVTALAVWASLEVVYYLHRSKFNKNIPGLVIIVPTSSILIDALGDILRYYSKFEWYDQVAHFIGGMAVALVVFYIVRVYAKYKGYKMGNGFIALYAIFGTAFFAALYEIEEYAETILLNNNRLGDRLDTPNDLLLTIIGGVIGALIILLYLQIKKK